MENRNPTHGYNSVYQEVKGDKVYLYLEKMAGTFSYKIPVLPRYAGAFTMNPSQVSLMYFPLKSGNNQAQQVLVTNP